MEKLASIRGAITVKENSIKEIKNSTTLLLTELLKQNKLDKSKIINIIFTVTDDINELNPATVSREEFQLDSVPILCVQEMKIKNGLPKCIWVLIQTYTRSEEHTSELHSHFH